MFLNNRYHDPTLGSFISVDPLVTITGQAYIYGNANPIRFSDPTGLCGEGDPREGEPTICVGSGEDPSEPPPVDPFVLAAHKILENGRSEVEEVIVPTVAPPSWCGQPPCPTAVGPDQVFDDDAQAVAYLDYIIFGTGSGVYTFVDSAVNSEELWAHYTTASGRQDVRWRSGLGWVRTRAGLPASKAVSIGNTLKVGGRTLYVVGGGIEAVEQWRRDGDDYGNGVKLFRSFSAGGTKMAAVWGGASVGAGGATAFCGGGFTISCGGPWTSAAVVGVSGVVGGILGSFASDIIIERVL